VRALLRVLALATAVVTGFWVNTWDGMGVSTPQNGGDPIAFGVCVLVALGLFWLLDAVGL
jgi:hypothetical protein